MRRACATATGRPGGVHEVSGEVKKEKQAKVAAAGDLWIPAVNNWGGLGRWAFLEVSHVENAADLIRSTFLATADVRTRSV